MSGLFARTKSAGQDGVRYARSKHIGDLDDASVIYGSSRVSTDRSFHLLRPASSWAIRRATCSRADFRSSRHGGYRLLVYAARYHQAPSDAGKLVGQGHCDQLWRLSLQQRSEPWCWLMTALPDMP